MVENDGKSLFYEEITTINVRYRVNILCKVTAAAAAVAARAAAGAAQL